MNPNDQLIADAKRQSVYFHACGLPYVGVLIDGLLARVRELEAERDVMNGTACAEETTAGNGSCGVCTTCWRARVRELESESAGLRAVVNAARAMPRRTPEAGGCTTEHDYKIAAGVVWSLDRALLELDGQFAGPIPTPGEPHA